MQKSHAEIIEYDEPTMRAKELASFTSAIYNTGNLTCRRLAIDHEMTALMLANLGHKVTHADLTDLNRRIDCVSSRVSCIQIPLMLTGRSADTV